MPVIKRELRNDEQPRRLQTLYPLSLEKSGARTRSQNCTYLWDGGIDVPAHWIVAIENHFGSVSPTLLCVHVMQFFKNKEKSITIASWN